MVRWLALIVLACAASCGETEVDLALGDVEGPPLSVTYFVEGGGADELRSLFLTVRDIRLLGPEDLAAGAGGIGALPEPRALELLGLEERARLLTTRYYGDGVYSHVRVDLGAEPVRAVGHDGGELEWSDLGPPSVLLPLEVPLRAERDAALNVALILHVSPDESIARDGSGAGDATYRFHPVFRARVLQPTERVAADDLWGGVMAASDDLRRLEVASEQDTTTADRAVPVAVDLGPGTLLLQSNGALAADLPGATSLSELTEASFWIRGEFTGSTHPFLPELRASSVLLDRLYPSNASAAALVAEVRIVGVEAGGVLAVRLLEVERGGEEFAHAFGVYEPSRVWRARLGPLSAVIDAAGAIGDRTDLHVGMRAKLHLPGLALEPFAALRAVSQGPPEHHGHIAEQHAIGATASLRLAPESAALASGMVASEDTLVAVEANSLFATLDVQGKPSVLVHTLPPGVRAVVRGRIGGTADAPLIESGKVIVRPGRFQGFVAAASESSGTFDATIESIDAPFGGETSSPPFLARIAPNAVFEGGAATAAEFFELFRSLTAGERLSVRVAGLASAQPNEVDAYQVCASVE
jgi:hypothetical protein